jgi:hypothetical protein
MNRDPNLSPLSLLHIFHWFLIRAGVYMRGVNKDLRRLAKDLPVLHMISI